MIRVVRNIGIHLWVTTLLTIPVSFYILPGLNRFFPGVNAMVTGGIILIGLMGTSGFLMDYAARKKITAFIKQGQIWERAGIYNKAEKNYANALRVYDSFLLWPFSTKKMAEKLSRAIATFNLNTPIENPDFEPVTAAYLKMNPEDEDIAGLWLSQLQESNHVTPLAQDVLSLLVETHRANKGLMRLIADIRIDLERKEFIDKKLYHPVLGASLSENRYLERVETVIGNDYGAIQKQASIFLDHRKPEGNREKGKIIQQAAAAAITHLKTFLALTRSIAGFFMVSLTKGVAFMKEHEKMQLYFKTGFFLIVLLGLGFFMINTLSHMFKPGSSETEKSAIQIKIPTPFTIQVAAYLEEKHAHNYVERLKKKGIDAMVKRVDGGGKIWYVIHVAEFPDKQSAAAYGQELKQQKIIDDFFVNNKQ